MDLKKGKSKLEYSDVFVEKMDATSNISKRVEEVQSLLDERQDDPAHLILKSTEVA
ncbi:hypothetical protein Syun_005390 [Stephania yunnanensis]|uniref:Uncharacterized protein n=1 Tax=Stephania yunnanensis TaxID=152371 RepID=A0AAP0L4P5_9MAGN